MVNYIGTCSSQLWFGLLGTCSMQLLYCQQGTCSIKNLYDLNNCDMVSRLLAPSSCAAVVRLRSKLAAGPVQLWQGQCRVSRACKLRASLSGTFPQTLPEGALFISAQQSTDAVNALRKVWVLITLRASLSGTFLQRKDVVNQCLEFGC